MKLRHGRHPSHRSSPRLAVAALALIGLGALALAPSTTFAQQNAISVDRAPGVHGGELVVPVNKSQVLKVDRPFVDLLVGNAEIADVMALTNQSVYVLGKGIGTTSLTIYGANRALIAVLDLVVSHDVEGLKAKLFELMPAEKIEVRAAGEAVALSGEISSPTELARALQVAERYAPGKVSNFLRLRGSQQVMLQVRFAEVQRSAVKDLRIGTTALFSTRASRGAFGGGDTRLDPNIPPNTGSNVTIPTSSLGRGLALLATGNWNLSTAFDALESKGLVKTLAEPNLIALSGETASFLAGGEFPIPVAQAATTGGPSSITVEFKQFGVSLAFTPTVLGDDLINLVVAPEVSQIDFANAVTLSGFRVPGVTTRRAKTTVELRDGQSFAIAGLLQDDFTDNVDQLPWIGDVPVLGALFRSPRYNKRETELVVVITPRLVKPVKAGTLATPVDKFLPPSETDLFLFGRLERANPLGTGVVGAGGLSGSYGHIIK